MLMFGHNIYLVMYNVKQNILNYLIRLVNYKLKWKINLLRFHVKSFDYVLFKLNQFWMPQQCKQYVLTLYANYDIFYICILFRYLLMHKSVWKSSVHIQHVTRLTRCRERMGKVQIFMDTDIHICTLNIHIV